VSHIAYGNKTIAQYGAVLQMFKALEAGVSEMDIVTLIDDDVLVPSQFPGLEIEREFEDSTKVVLAYPLCAENADHSLFTTFQDTEYLGGNLGRWMHEHLGTQLFASGAIATWKVRQLKLILDRHCTAFNGEDLEMGLLLHKLSDHTTHKLGMDTAARIGLMMHTVVPTIVPVHLIHSYDLLPNPVRRKWNITPCSCGENSLFNQRVRSWDPASTQFFFKLLKIVFSPRGLFYGPKLFIRLLCFWRVLTTLRDYALVVGIVVSLVDITSVVDLLGWVAFYADYIFISWAIGILAGCVRSWCIARLHHAVRPDIIYAYPLLYGVTYGLFIRVATILYVIMYYGYAARFPPDVRTQMNRDPRKRDAVESCWEVEDEVANAVALGEHVRGVGNAKRNATKDSGDMESRKGGPSAYDGLSQFGSPSECGDEESSAEEEEEQHDGKSIAARTYRSSKSTATALTFRSLRSKSVLSIKAASAKAQWAQRQHDSYPAGLVVPVGGSAVEGESKISTKCTVDQKQSASFPADGSIAHLSKDGHVAGLSSEDEAIILREAAAAAAGEPRRPRRGLFGPKSGHASRPLASPHSDAASHISGSRTLVGDAASQRTTKGSIYHFGRDLLEKYLGSAWQWEAEPYIQSPPVDLQAVAVEDDVRGASD
jgi:hypothetical protein